MVYGTIGQAPPGRVPEWTLHRYMIQYERSAGSATRLNLQQVSCPILRQSGLSADAGCWQQGEVLDLWLDMRSVTYRAPSNKTGAHFIRDNARQLILYTASSGHAVYSVIKGDGAWRGYCLYATQDRCHADLGFLALLLFQRTQSFRHFFRTYRCRFITLQTPQLCFQHANQGSNADVGALADKGKKRLRLSICLPIPHGLADGALASDPHLPDWTIAGTDDGVMWLLGPGPYWLTEAATHFGRMHQCGSG